MVKGIMGMSIDARSSSNQACSGRWLTSNEITEVISEVTQLQKDAFTGDALTQYHACVLETWRV